MNVATIVAPSDSEIDQKLINLYRAHLIACGSKVEEIRFSIDKQAADIFFSGGTISDYACNADIFIQSVAHRRKKILIADMESTMIEQEMLDELAAEIGAGEKVAAITRQAMNGELDFSAALNERVHLLAQQPQELLEKVAKHMILMPGAQKLLTTMKETGAKCWLVSGGFTYFAKTIAENLGFDRYFANNLILERGRITGKVESPILDKDSKCVLLEKACAEYGAELHETMAVGDGANDIPMLKRCNEGGGLGVAYHAKSRVREMIPHQINHADLKALLYAQGFFFS